VVECLGLASPAFKLQDCQKKKKVIFYLSSHCESQKNIFVWPVGFQYNELIHEKTQGKHRSENLTEEETES
jgi:hypothetical protein